LGTRLSCHQVESLWQHPLLLAPVEVTDQGCSGDLHVISLVVLAQVVNAVQDVATNPVHSREVLHNSLEHTDCVSNMHVFATVETALQRVGK
jgi:homoserine kinase